MSKKIKNVLGLKISAPIRYFTDNGIATTPGAIGWALIKKVEELPANEIERLNSLKKTKVQKKENISEPEVIAIARKQIGVYLKDTRERKGITYYAVGKNAGLSIEQVQNIEAGEKAYTIDSFLRICRALDCYFFLENRDGKHLDGDDLTKNMKK